ncbi:hypothetical protein BDV96DRAFT_654304 [Lophiotrema nucula]|uniref:Rhodopsin domain-containing protein n=1 Tax=Lophiotrema nucula TaxID=690887 RepID=A0A6A5YJR9_9PLEO|nr:hypothetical protein BDV96DRAFT_654304 [Lophiotrema nucula]
MEALFHSLSPEEQAIFLNGPALKPPPGIIPQFTNPPNRNALCFGIVVTGTILALLAVGMRLYTKIFCVKRLRIEDCVMVSALAFHAGFVYIAWTLYNFPGGFVHQWNIRLKDVPVLLRGVNLGALLYGLAMMLLKVAILLDWIHIFGLSLTIRRKLYLTCILIIGVTIAFYSACVLSEIFACTPRSKIWNVFEPGTCVNTYAINVASSTFNFVLDVVMLVIPQQIIWQLTLSTQKKVAISAVFAVGILACVCGLLRIIYSVPFLTSPDKSYHVSAFALSAAGETTVGFLVLCIPSLPKLVKSTPVLQNLLAKMQTWVGLASADGEDNSRKGLPSWIRVRSGQRQLNGSDIGVSCLQESGLFGGAGSPAHMSISGVDVPEKSHATNRMRATGSDGSSNGVEFITVHEV